eukprot:COSAG02_NODE_5462_length_4300_cov_3.302309_5_plen_112_part_00
MHFAAACFAAAAAGANTAGFSAFGFGVGFSAFGFGFEFGSPTVALPSARSFSPIKALPFRTDVETLLSLSLLRFSPALAARLATLLDLLPAIVGREHRVSSSYTCNRDRQS